MRSQYARCAATKSPTASPPNFSWAATASSHATAASATTASASTAATSERSTSAVAASPVARSTERERLHQRRQRLHRRADDDLLAVRDAGLDAAGVVRRRGGGRCRSRRAPPIRAAREREPVADLDALHRLDPHHRGGQPCVEPVLLRRVRAEPGRHAGRAHLDDAADRVALGCAPRRSRARSASSSTVEPVTAMPISREQRLRDRAGGDVHRGVPRRRALERVAHVVVAVLEHAGEVGVPGPRQRHRLRRPCPTARPRAATASSPTSSSCGRGSRRRARAASRACGRAGGPRARSTAVLLDLLARRAAVARLPSLRGRRRSRRGRASSPAGSPVTIATSAGPWDSPADERRRDIHVTLECGVMALALQILASGFAAGAVYGLVGVGHSVVFRLDRRRALRLR